MTLTQDRRHFALFAFGGLAIFLIVFWFGVSVPVAFARPAVEALAHLFGLATAMPANPKGGWFVLTPYWINVGPPHLLGTYAQIPIGERELNYAVRAFPIFIALMLAPPWNSALMLRFFLGLGAVYLHLVLSALALINLQVSILVTGKLNPIFENGTPPTLRVFAQPYGEFAFWLSGVGFYFLMFFVSLILPVMLWAILKPEAIAMLMRPTGPDLSEPQNTVKS